jgi:hypothetical protein
VCYSQPNKKGIKSKIDPNPWDDDNGHGTHGGPSDSLVLQSAVTDAASAGVVLVAAAGNEASNVSSSGPLCKVKA